jgi:hypothetical protein
MEFKGTKGKWEVDKYNNVFSKYQLPIAVVYDGSTAHNSFKESNKDICKANAKLISCAPEMLDMLIKSYENLNGYCPEKIFEEIEQLIKKATEI